MGGRVVQALVAPIVLIVAVLGSILAGVATPTEAAGVGAIGATLLAGQRFVPDRPLPIYAAALGLIGLLLLTSLLDLRLGRSEIPAADQAGIALAFLACALLAFGLLVALLRA